MPIPCRTCNKITTTTSPLLIKRLRWNRYCVLGLCIDCKGTKQKMLSNTQSKKLPQIFFVMPIPSSALDCIKDENGNMVELYPLLDEIINA